MLTVDARKCLSIVLVGARNPQNIGAAARAMQDFGFSDLRVVNEFSPPFEAARLEARSAVAADHIMRSAQLFSSLSDALTDCTTVIGTTAIGGRELSGQVCPLADLAPQIVTLLTRAAEDPAPDGTATGRVALLFGSEKTGLTREQLSYCSLLLTIPMFAPEGRHLSMNLGQSVAVCLYELVRLGFEGSRDLNERRQAPPNGRLRDQVLAALLEVMYLSGYTRRFPANARPEVVRQLAQQLGRTRDEAATWMGFLQQVRRYLDQHSPSEEQE